jgi:hypothetical protein
MKKKDNLGPESTEARSGVSEEDRRGALKAGLFFAAAIAVILLLKVLLGY